MTDSLYITVEMGQTVVLTVLVFVIAKGLSWLGHGVREVTVKYDEVEKRLDVLEAERDARGEQVRADAEPRIVK